MWAEPQQRPPQRVSEATGCVIGRPRAIVTPEKQLLLDEKAARKSAREARKAEALAGGPPATRKRKADGGEAARVGRPPDTPEVRQAKALAKAEAKAAQQALESAEDPDGSIREAVQRARLEASAARRRQKREDASKVGVVEPQLSMEQAIHQGVLHGDLQEYRGFDGPLLFPDEAERDRTALFDAFERDGIFPNLDGLGHLDPALHPIASSSRLDPLPLLPGNHIAEDSSGQYIVDDEYVVNLDQAVAASFVLPLLGMGGAPTTEEGKVQGDGGAMEQEGDEVKPKRGARKKFVLAPELMVTFDKHKASHVATTSVTGGTGGGPLPIPYRYGSCYFPEPPVVEDPESTAPAPEPEGRWAVLNPLALLPPFSMLCHKEGCTGSLKKNGFADLPRLINGKERTTYLLVARYKCTVCQAGPMATNQTLLSRLPPNIASYFPFNIYHRSGTDNEMAAEALPRRDRSVATVAARRAAKAAKVALNLPFLPDPLSPNFDQALLAGDLMVPPNPYEERDELALDPDLMDIMGDPIPVAPYVAPPPRKKRHCGFCNGEMCPGRGRRDGCTGTCQDCGRIRTECEGRPAKGNWRGNKRCALAGM